MRNLPRTGECQNPAVLLPAVFIPTVPHPQNSDTIRRAALRPITTFFFFFNKFIYLFLAASGRCCCAQAFSSCGERGLLFVVMLRLLIAVASCCGARALGARASVVVARVL